MRVQAALLVRSPLTLLRHLSNPPRLLLPSTRSFLSFRSIAPPPPPSPKQYAVVVAPARTRGSFSVRSSQVSDAGSIDPPMMQSMENKANTQGANTPSTPKSFIPSVKRDNIAGKQYTLYGWAHRLIAHGLIQSTDPNLLIHGKTVGSGNFKIALTEVVDSTCQLWLPDGFQESIGEVGVGGFVVWPEHSIEVMNG